MKWIIIMLLPTTHFCTFDFINEGDNFGQLESTDNSHHKNVSGGKAISDGPNPLDRGGLGAKS